MAAVAVLFAVACQQPRRPDDLGVSSVQYEDLRVPTRMRLIDEDSRSHSTQAGTGYRYGSFTYVGDVPVDEIVDYLQDTMPQHQWRVVADRGEGTALEPRVLEFERGVYEATYTMGRTESDTTMTVDLRTRPDRAVRDAR